MRKPFSHHAPVSYHVFVQTTQEPYGSSRKSRYSCKADSKPKTISPETNFSVLY